MGKARRGQLDRYVAEIDGMPAEVPVKQFVQQFGQRTFRGRQRWPIYPDGSEGGLLRAVPDGHTYDSLPGNTNRQPSERRLAQQEARCVHSTCTDSVLRGTGQPLAEQGSPDDVPLLPAQFLPLQFLQMRGLSLHEQFVDRLGW